MAIIINHRFISRLLPNSLNDFRTLIVGTFNPGLPDIGQLTKDEREEFKEIENSPRFKRINEVKNFYDRPQNRFWKIHDVVNDEKFYRQNSFKSRNPNGLKFYRGLSVEREVVFARQQEYCKQKGIFITDLVKQIRPTSFRNIYNNFPDSAIEKSDCDWNTDGIIQYANSSKVELIIINFKITNTQLPKISSHVSRITDETGAQVINLLSTSGAAGNTYETLIKNWIPHLAMRTNQNLHN